VHVFPGPVLTVFLGVRRSPRLVRFHRAVRRALGGTSVRSSSYYRPSVWVPHITLAVGDIRPSQLPDVLQFLGTRDLRWTLPVTSVSALWENQGVAILGPTFSFSLTK
jgi:2'-5' RNA ligase